MEYINFLVKNNVVKEFIKALDTVIDYYDENGSFQDINEDEVPFILKSYKKDQDYYLIQTVIFEISPQIISIDLNKTVQGRYVIDEMEDVMEFDIDDVISFKHQLKRFVLSKSKGKTKN